MKRVTKLLVSILSLVILCCGCLKQDKYYDIPSDVIETANYQAQIGDYLAKSREHFLDKIYSLEGLNEQEYLYIEHNFFTGPPEYRVLISRNVKEPILRYKVNKVHIRTSRDQILTVINDEETIKKLTNLRIQEPGIDWEEGLLKGEDFNAQFYFDLPCELIWTSRLVISEKEAIYWICIDEATTKTIYYDVTSILSSLLDFEEELK